MNQRSLVAPALLASLLAGTASGAAPAPTTPSTSSPATSAEMLSDVGQLRWENRLVFVFVGGADSAAVAVETLAAAEAGIEDRHVLWFVIEGEVVLTNYEGRLDPGLAANLRADYLPAAETPPVAVVLVGKDGGVKYRAGELDLGEIFREIDGMPMRQQEMRSNR
jgi:hypothetical protein